MWRLTHGDLEKRDLVAICFLKYGLIEQDSEASFGLKIYDFHVWRVS